MQPIEVLILPLVFIFAWVSSFLWHEVMHIQSQGRHGSIYIDSLSMTAFADRYWNSTVFYYAGGLLSGVIFICIGCCLAFYSLPVGYIFGMVGVTNMVYGVFEGLFLQRWGNNLRYKVGRYGIYIGTTISMILIWWWLF